ncbi:MAG: sigma-54 dependent transcriptional regulator [Phycisphaerae bacterium]|nr:sigma-54 dependent transcriptional regulator [Phycisphaerae bacterium]
MARICVVDDKDVMRDSLQTSLQRAGHSVSGFGDPAAALEALQRESFEVVISDLKMPGMDGIELLRQLRAAGVETPLILMTAFATVGTAVEAMKQGAFDYLQKPFEVDELLLLVERAAQMGRLRDENEALRASLVDLQSSVELVGGSRVMGEIRAQIQRVAQSQATVLIHGESGTGKELVARAIHAASSRASRPMLCLNCAALSATLLESELFGHERGAFTGADRMRKGRFELADGGTLLLDEISELPIGLQAKLLRVLQEREYERVGSSLTRRTDVRVIATTNRDLQEWVTRKRFREDLYFRISVLPVRLAPLRERREDIPELVRHFLERIARREGRASPQATPRAMQVLQSYHWPGNVRELENVCERAIVLCPGGMIEATVIENWLTNDLAQPDPNAFRRVRHGHMMEDMERELIERTLLQFNGHREKTARALGIGVRTLGMKLKQWREEANAAAARAAMDCSPARRAG